MRLIKSNIPTDRKNSFFIKVLSGILVFCLLLVSFVFLLIYQNVKKRSLEQSYLAEQDIVSNVSYSASIMQDTASSMLTQLNGDPKLLQLIYSMDTESLSVIQSMQLLQNYTRASSWLDSVYIYCAEEDCICYAYANGNTYQLSFGTLDDFFDAAFVRNLAAVSRVTQKPAMRQLRYRSTSSDKTVFSYVLPVRTSLNRYNGFFVANISAERLMHIQAAVMDTLTPPLPVGDRYVTLGLSLAPRDPGEGSLAFSAEWLDDNIAGQGGEDAPLMEHFAFSFNGEQEKE